MILYIVTVLSRQQGKTPKNEPRSILSIIWKKNKREYLRKWYWTLSDEDRQKVREYGKNWYYSISQKIQIINKRVNERILERIQGRI